MIDVAKQIKSRGASRVFSFATFGLFTGGFDKFDEAAENGWLDKVFTTNLVYTDPEAKNHSWYCEVNMCKYVSYIIETLNRDESTSVIIDPVKKIRALMEKHSPAPGNELKIDFDGKEAEKTDRTDKTAEAEKTDRAVKAEKTDRAVKAEKSVKTGKAVKTDKTVKSEKAAKAGKK